MLTVGSLFAGIGGFDLGLERAGMQVKWQVEIDPYCLKVLEKHWPHVRRYTDIKEVQWEEVEPVDLVCGGFPCQSVSVAGKRKGTADARWLWPEFARCLGVLRPRYILIENVPGLLTANDGLAFAEILWDLAACGYDAEWDCIPAAAVGAPHIRDRVWLLANSSVIKRFDGYERRFLGGLLPQGNGDDSTKWSKNWELIKLVNGVCERDASDWWKTQSRMDRSIDGIPDQLDRNASLGNAVVPQVVEWIGRHIVKAEESLV